MRILAWVAVSFGVLAMAAFLSWLGEEYAWHAAVAPSIALAYAIIAFSTLKPRAAKKVVKKQ